MSSRWKERNAKSRKDWSCEEENPYQSEEDALAWDRQLYLGQWQWMRKGWTYSQEIPRERKESKRTSETPQGTWLGGAQEVASGSATQGLWLRNGKVGSQVSDIDRSRFPGRRTAGEVRRGGRRGRWASDIAKKRVYRFRVRFGWKRRASRLPCLSLDLGDDWRGASRSGDVSLAIFITSVSGSESLASFTNHLFHFSRPPGFRMAFDATERNGRFGRNQCQRGKESSSSGKRKTPVFLCKRTVRVKVGGKAIAASFLKIEGRGTLVGAIGRRKRGG